MKRFISVLLLVSVLLPLNSCASEKAANSGAYGTAAEAVSQTSDSLNDGLPSKDFGGLLISEFFLATANGSTGTLWSMNIMERF